jgi:hypothetical protein
MMISHGALRVLLFTPSHLSNDLATEAERSSLERHDICHEGLLDPAFCLRQQQRAELLPSRLLAHGYTPNLRASLLWVRACCQAEGSCQLRRRRDGAVWEALCCLCDVRVRIWHQPNDADCRCGVVLVAEDEVRRDGILLVDLNLGLVALLVVEDLHAQLQRRLVVGARGAEPRGIVGLAHRAWDVEAVVVGKKTARPQTT